LLKNDVDYLQGQEAEKETLGRGSIKWIFGLPVAMNKLVGEMKRFCRELPCWNACNSTRIGCKLLL